MHYVAAIAALPLALAMGHGPSAMLQRAAEVSDASQAYVAQLDGDWNVIREIRVPCSIDAGCAVDLGLAQGDSARVHVRFDPLRSGRIGVGSVLTDKGGRSIAQPGVILNIDRSGFGADHLQAGLFKAAARDGVPTADAEAAPIILVAVKVPGWAAPLAPKSSSDDRS